MSALADFVLQNTWAQYVSILLFVGLPTLFVYLINRK